MRGWHSPAQEYDPFKTREAMPPTTKNRPEWGSPKRDTMHFPDLHLFPDGHPPSPYERPVLIVKIGDGFLPKGFRLCAVGWLEKMGFSTGRVPDECIDALVDACSGQILSDGSRGVHACALCGRGMPRVRWRGKTVRLKSHGHYLVLLGQTVYMAPELLLHYIRTHHYRPPQEFIEATIRGRFMREDDLDIEWRPKEG